MGPWALAPGHFNQRSSVGSVSWVSSSINKKHFFLEQLTSSQPPAASLRLASKSLGPCPGLLLPPRACPGLSPSQKQEGKPCLL